MTEIVDIQNEIIQMQSDIIDSLFMRLAQILTVEELDAMPELEKMQEAVERRQKL